MFKAYSIHMLMLHPNSAHDHWKQAEGSCHGRRTPQENWEVRPNASAAVQAYTGKMTLEISV